MSDLSIVVNDKDVKLGEGAHVGFSDQSNDTLLVPFIHSSSVDIARLQLNGVRIEEISCATKHVLRVPCLRLGSSAN